MTSAALTLRPYQLQTLQTTQYVLRHQPDIHPVIALPTGSGKALIAACLASTLPGRVLVVTHRKRLIEQNRRQLASLGLDDGEAGVYSAGLAQRDVKHRMIFAGVQSIFRRMDHLQQVGNFDWIIIDEAHLVPPPDQDSMYGTVFRACPAARRIGLSATPSRMGMPIYQTVATPGGAHAWNAWFTHKIVDVNILELTPDYLAPLVGVLTASDVDMRHVHIRQGEFIASEASAAMSEAKAARLALNELCLIAAHRQAWILFCCDIAHTNLVAAMLTDLGVSCGVMHSGLSAEENARHLAAFEQGKTRALASCVMLTTGFDHPRVDCVALLRPTMSRELMIQMIGRGTRHAPGKTNALVVDFAGNLARHAPLDGLPEIVRSVPKVAKDTEDAQRDAEAQAKRDAVLRQTKIRHDLEASTDPLFGVGPASHRSYTVRRMEFTILRSKKPPHPRMVLATYFCEMGPRLKRLTVFVCLEHQGYPRKKAEEWFRRRGLIAPQSCDGVMRAIQQARRPTRIEVDESKQYPDLLAEHFAPVAVTAGY